MIGEAASKRTSGQGLGQGLSLLFTRIPEDARVYRDVNVDLRDVVFLQFACDNVAHSLGTSDDVDETKPPNFTHTRSAAIEGKEQELRARDNYLFLY